MNARQRRQVERAKLRWMPTIWKAFHEAADHVERAEAGEAIANLRICAAHLNDAYRSATKRSIRQAPQVGAGDEANARPNVEVTGLAPAQETTK